MNNLDSTFLHAWEKKYFCHAFSRCILTRLCLVLNLSLHVTGKCTLQHLRLITAEALCPCVCVWVSTESALSHAGPNGRAVKQNKFLLYCLFNLYACDNVDLFLERNLLTDLYGFILVYRQNWCARCVSTNKIISNELCSAHTHLFLAGLMWPSATSSCGRLSTTLPSPVRSNLLNFWWRPAPP